MFDNLNLRNKFLALAAVPVNVLVMMTVWAAGAGHHGLAALAGAGAVLTMGLAWNLAGTVAGRLAALTAAADDLAISRLPALLGQLDQPQRRAAAVAEAPASGPDDQPHRSAPPAPAGHDELARLGASLERIETEARILVDRERDAIARHLGAMVKNLARRNQSLLDRQIEHIDWLEAKEQDPERLEQLFKLDHLATRMRRTSESVLVLGGAESTRHRGGPAPIADVLRVAMGETEDYRNIRLRTVDPASIAGAPAFDLAHLLAEVLENATQFSPPESPVELHATALEDGRLRLTVIDRGVGMDQRQLDGANAIVADPPEISLSVGHAVGFIVIGRLARRIGATVELSATAGSGVTVQIEVPASAVIFDHQPAPVDNTKVAVAPAEAIPPPSTARAEAPAPTPAGPLERLLGLGEAELPEGEGWVPPAVGRGRARPLRARDGAVAAVPEGLRPAQDRPARITPDGAPIDAGAGAQAGVEEEQPTATAAETHTAGTSAGTPAGTGLPRVAAMPAPTGEGPGPLTTEALMADARAAEAAAAEALAAEANPATASPADTSPANASPANASPANASPANASPANLSAADPSPAPANLSAADPSPAPANLSAADPSPAPANLSAADPSAADPAGEGQAGSLAEALPSGAAFDRGVEKLLDPARRRPPSGPAPAVADRAAVAEQGPWTPPAGPAAPDGPSLTRRQRGASPAPSAAGPGARASARKPEDIRSMLTRYRDGLKGTGTGPAAPGSIVPSAPGPGPQPAADPVPAAPPSCPPASPAGADPNRPNARSRRRDRPPTPPSPEDN